MQEYISARKVRAKPMGLGEYAAYRKWGACKQEDTGEQGYLVEQFDKGITNHKDHEGYISWVDKKTFELNYCPHVNVGVAELDATSPSSFKVKAALLSRLAIEQKAKTKTAPRVTPSDIEALIRSQYYFTATAAIVGHTRGPQWQATPSDLDRLTFCVLVLANGFVVTGEAACASPENFNADIGKSIARENAVNKVWPLLGYELRTKLTS